MYIFKTFFTLHVPVLTYYTIDIKHPLLLAEELNDERWNSCRFLAYQLN